MGSKKKGNNGPDKYSPEYKEKRMKNNVAVKRSRDKSKAKAREAQSRVQQLQIENEHLQSTVDNMTAELRYLKEMLISQAGTGTTDFLSPDTVADLEEILQEEAPTDLAKLTTVLNEMKRIHTIQIKNDPHQQGYVGNGGGMYQQGQNSQMYHPNGGGVYDPSLSSHYPL